MKRYACMSRALFTRGAHSIMAVQPDHIEGIRIWRNAQIEVLRQPAPITRDQQIAYFERCIWPAMDESRPRNILVIYRADGDPVGYGGLVHIDWNEHHAELSFLLAPEYTTDEVTYAKLHVQFLELVKTLAFSDLRLDYLTTETYPQRTAIIRNLESAGFVLDEQPPGSVVSVSVRADSVFHRCTKPTARD